MKNNTNGQSLQMADAKHGSERENIIEVTGDFEKQKLKSLSSIDNSKKGSVDSRIVDLVDFINGSNDFFTTSSCSGRLAVISEVCHTMVEVALQSPKIMRNTDGLLNFNPLSNSQQSLKRLAGCNTLFLLGQLYM